MQGISTVFLRGINARAFTAVAILALYAVTSTLGFALSSINDTLSDDFEDGTMNTALWVEGSFTRDVGPNHARVGLSESNGELQITPVARNQQAGYSGYVSKTLFDMTGTWAEVMIRQVAAQRAETSFSIGTSASDFYRITAHNNQMVIDHVVGGVYNTSKFNFNTSTPYWRFIHDVGSDTISLEVSRDRVRWQNIHFVARTFPVNSLKAELTSGSAASVPFPGTARFDYFRVGRPTSGPSPSPTPLPATPRGLRAWCPGSRACSGWRRSSRTSPRSLRPTTCGRWSNWR